MATHQDKRRHDILQAVRILGSLVELIDDGVDFSSEEGKELLEEARKAKALVEKEIERLFRNDANPE